MNWKREDIKVLALLIGGGIAFYCGLQNLPALAAALKWVLGILAPFLLGCAIAFILNVPMRAIERHLYPNSKKGARLRRPLAYAATLALVCGVLVLASFVIGPGVAEAASAAAGQLPASAARLQAWLQGLEEYLPQIESVIEQLDIDWASLTRKATELAQSWGAALLSSGGGLIGGVVSGVSTFLIGFIFSIYILLQKERLARQCRQCLYALLPARLADRTLEVLRLAERTFSHFLSGQCLEACILGTLFVVAMTVLRMPYALLVGVLIAITALIPIVGAFIGCAVGALLIALANPWQGLAFIALFLVLQQIEGNLIYPHVVGSSVGLPSIWVLAAVTVGGKLMGVVGMLVFIPLCSVLYTLFRGFVRARLSARGVPPEKWRDPPGGK